MKDWFLPHYRLDDVLHLDCAGLRSLAIEGLLLDLDGTLKEYHVGTIPQTVVDWTRRLLTGGLRVCLLSNGRPRRVERFASMLGVPFVAKAFKPLPFGCRRALRLLGVDASRAGLVGDQVFADVLAGRLAGLRTFLVPPRHAVAEEPWFTRIKRPFEQWVLSRNKTASGSGLQFVRISDECSS